MPPESTNGAGRRSGGGLAVPMAWLCAEYQADQTMRGVGLTEPGSVEHRAAVRALALTVHLSGRPGAAGGGGPEEWLRRTAHGSSWPEWVEERLAAGRAEDPGSADLALADTAWRALRETWVHAADLDDPPVPGAGPRVDESVRTWLPAWELGLPLAHLTLWLG